ncbi:MAG TPA: hypothetical protein VHO69_18195, partial [Phototrophicaceae bacterium]|nr:hypothetical protein [Phototrophicaceae bacterium]
YEQFLAAHTEDYAEYVACMNKSHFGRGDCAKYSVYYFDYFLVRRVIAYALLGDEKNLQASLAALRATPYPTEFGEALLDVQPHIAESLCQAAYDYYDTLPVPEWGLVQQKMAIIPGTIIENINDGRDYSIGYNLDPNSAGCDLTLFNDVPTPTPTITPTTYPTYPPPTPDTRTPEEKGLEYSFASSAFDADNYEVVLQIVEKHQDSGSEDDNMQMRYYRALALEALHRPDEALAEYIAIAEAAPDSAWAKLAVLHFERAETP